MLSIIDAPPPASRARGEQEFGTRALVRRYGLFQRLSEARAHGVTLLCAPAGSGKTVLVRSWLDAMGLRERAAWVSVARGEDDAQRFTLSVIDALAAVTPAVQRAAPTPTLHGEAVLDGLLGALESLDDPVLLVIDDLHELRSASALMWLERLLVMLPEQLQVVLATREHPRLRLHRLRLAGNLTELRAVDLLFSLDETSELLQMAGITLSDRGLALLHERTEGWVAGLRLAAISLSRHADPERFVREFSGSERTVAGYLLAEVLERQPAEVRELLLRTSVLERVSGPLADFLTGGSGSERILQELEDAGAFVTSMDVRRSWFRYHRLFADLLALELRRTAPASVGSLHRAAAQWYEHEGCIIEAIRHAQAARDWPLASRLLAQNHLDLTLDGRAGAISELLRAFPDDVAAADGQLALVFAVARLTEQELEQSAGYVDAARRLADAVPQESRARFDSLLALLRLVIARRRSDLETAIDAMQVLETALAGQPAREGALNEEFRAIALESLGVTELWASRFADARRHLEGALALARRAERPRLEIADLGHLAIAHPLTGRSFSDALEASETAVRIADAHGYSEDPALLTALAAGGMASLWLGRLDEADRSLARAHRTVPPDGEPASQLILHHAQGLLCLAQGQPEAALAALRNAQRMQRRLAGRHAFATAVRARLVQAQAVMGQLAAARETLAGASEAERDWAEMRVAEAIVALARHEPEDALDVLGPATEGAAPAIHRPSVTTEAQVLDALARERLGDQRAAEASLERALELAEPEGIVLPFILAPVEAMLERQPRHHTAHATLRRTILDVLAGSPVGPRGERPELLDELSDAELRVVRYLPSNLRAPEIAAELCVSTNTIRTHLRHIYAKLDAHGRSEAVSCARHFGLLAPGLRGR
ncbi:MAG TPA: LuxR C-terminal-related transcriptional regulator [Solirubrobacteraceae bacterium]|nr:LuxR C-terminal-related transcriptional regulator [Solirubrobacteraceae bacterium]